MSRFSLFVGDLSAVTNEQDLYILFQEIGVITDVRIKRDPTNNRSLMYGFVEFDSPKSATDAIRLRNGYLHNGRRIRVSWASRKNQNNKSNLVDSSATMPIAGKRKISSILVHFIRVSGVREVTESWLKSIFESFGPVVNISIRHQIYPAQSGFCFIEFSNDDFGHHIAKTTVNFMKNRNFDGILISAEMNLYQTNTKNDNISSFSNGMNPTFSSLPQDIPINNVLISDRIIQILDKVLN